MLRISLMVHSGAKPTFVDHEIIPRACQKASLLKAHRENKKSQTWSGLHAGAKPTLVDHEIIPGIR